MGAIFAAMQHFQLDRFDRDFVERAAAVPQHRGRIIISKMDRAVAVERDQLAAARLATGLDAAPGQFDPVAWFHFFAGMLVLGNR